MDIDFTKLEAISDARSDKPIATNQCNDLQGFNRLQREANINKAEIERAQGVYRKYQEDRKASGRLQAEILKGAKAGEDIHILFLKACQALSLTTSNTLFYEQLELDIRNIYQVKL
jgi:hypothetical protein